MDQNEEGWEYSIKIALLVDSRPKLTDCNPLTVKYQHLAYQFFKRHICVCNEWDQ